MKYILQVSTGSWQDRCVGPEEIIRKIGEIASRIPVESVIIGCGTDASVYRAVGEYLRGAGIRMLLWLPVFSEVGAVAGPDGALDLFGNPVARPEGQEGDAFVFGCPSSRRNLRIPEEIYDRYFSSCGFDGVFLDRIRSQSFASGVSGVLSCGCARCRQAFREKGVDPDEVRAHYETGQDAFFDMDAWPADGLFVLRDPVAQRFFEAKEEIVAEAVTELTRRFKARGLIVGLDLFAPLISRFVGQNYTLITEGADFIKPMLYRRTEAPAGIGYEYALFRRHAPGARGRAEFRMDRSFLETQLDAVSRVPCAKYPGIEINYNAELVKTDPAYITESLAAVRDRGFDGAALCWNILQAPDAHLDAAVNLPAAAASACTSWSSTVQPTSLLLRMLIS